ncbi:hypothetical protein P9112_008671 [Eukaryota sp. TZLM1-RC]
MPFFGVDLGADKCRLCSLDSYGRPIQISSIPTAVAISNGVTLCGDDALDLLQEEATVGVQGFKLLLGQKYCSPEIQNEVPHLPFIVQSSDEGECVIELENNQYTATELYAIILETLKSQHQSDYNTTVSNVVLSVPSFFNDRQRTALISAARMTDLTPLGLIQESLAAALAFQQHTSSRLIGKSVLVFDLGASKLDVTILKGDDLSILSNSSTQMVSCSKFDDVIFDWFCNHASSQLPQSVINNVDFRQQLQLKSRQAKETLSQSPSAFISIEGSSFKKSIKLSDFERESDLFFVATMRMVNTALKSAGLSAECVNEVIMVGAGSNIPRMKQMLRDKFGNTKVKVDFPRDVMVVKGLALLNNFAHLERHLINIPQQVPNERMDKHAVRTWKSHLIQLRDELEAKISDPGLKLSKAQINQFKKIIKNITTELGNRNTANNLASVYQKAIQDQNENLGADGVEDRQLLTTASPYKSSGQSLVHSMFNTAAIPPASGIKEPPNDPNNPFKSSGKPLVHQIFNTRTRPQSNDARSERTVNHSDVAIDLDPEFRFLAQTPSPKARRPASNPNDQPNSDEDKGLTLAKSIKKCKGCLFYLFLISIFVFLFVGVPFTTTFDVVSTLFCPSSVLTDAGHVSFSHRNPEFNLHHASFGYYFESEVYYNYEFDEVPEVFVAILNVETSKQIAFDVNVSYKTKTHFLLIIRTQAPLEYPREIFLDGVGITWVAVGTMCTKEQLAYSNSQFAFINGNSNWKLNSVTPFSYQNSNDIIILSAFQGVYFEGLDGFNDIQQETSISEEPKSHNLKVDAVFTSEGSVQEFRHNSLSFNYSEARYNTIDIGQFQINQGLGDSGQFALKVDFSFEFTRVPNVFVFLDGFQTYNSSLSYRIEVVEILFTSFTVNINMLSDSPMKIWFNFIAIDENFDTFDAVDLILFSIFLCLLITALLLELHKPNLVGAYNTDEEQYHNLGDYTHVANYTPPKPEEVSKAGSYIPRDIKWLECLTEWRNVKQDFSETKRDTFGIIFWMVFGMILLVFLLLFYREFILATKFFHSVQSVYITLFILGLEHFLIVLAFFTVTWPPHRMVKGYNHNPSNVAVLIASHMSAGKDPQLVKKDTKKNFFKYDESKLKENQSNVQAQFTRALRLASDSVANGNVYVCHNTGDEAPHPTDKTVRIIRNVEAWGRKVNYVYIPAGNKTFCLYYVAKNILGNRKDIDYVVIMDDDVVIPRDMSWQTHRLKKDNVCGAVVTIRADINDPEKSGFRRRKLLVWFQDLEYLLSGLMKQCQSNLGTGSYPHGAISIWKKDALIEILDHHNTAFHGEDAMMGFLTRQLMPGKKLITFAATPALTQVPTDLFHLGEDLFGDHAVDDKSLFNQRVKSWDVCAHRFFFKYLEHFIRFWNSDTLILKPFYLYEMITIIRDYFHVLIIAYFVIMDDIYPLGLIYIRVLLIQYIIFFTFNYIKLRRRKDLQSPLIVVILFPFYRLVLSFFRIFALFHNLFEYLPKKRMPSSEDPNLKVPYLHKFISKLNEPEDWQRIWSMQ